MPTRIETLDLANEFIIFSEHFLNNIILGGARGWSLPTTSCPNHLKIDGAVLGMPLTFPHPTSMPTYSLLQIHP